MGFLKNNMIRRDFEQLKFKDLKDEEIVEVTFLNHFYFRLSYDELNNIGKFSVGNNFLEFDTNEKKTRKLDFLISKGFDNLTSRITGKKTIYLHSNSGIPLIGNGSFGIVDRGSNIIEIKPVCGCNINCIYCSVDENRRSVDFVIEKDYLVDELKKVVAIKDHPVEIHIGCQGEPLLYSPLVELVRDCAKIPNVTKISMDTNVTLLNEKIVDDLVDAGFTQFNTSLNSLNADLAKKIADGPYNVDHVKKIIKYVGTKDVLLVIAPVWIQKVNDDEMDKIIELCKETGATPGFQNYFNYSFGKKVGKEISLEEFYKKLRVLEEKHDIKLIVSAEDFEVVTDNELPKPFKKGDSVHAELVCPGRMPNEFIAVAQSRTISVYDNTNKLQNKLGQNIKLKIIKSKHNIFVAEQ